MRLLEEYQEFVERDPMEISYFWKYAQLFLYILIALFGYTYTILFYTFWENIFGGHCPFWAKVAALPKPVTIWPNEEELINDNNKNNNDYIEAMNSISSNYTDWRQSIIASGEYQNRCHSYYIISCCSCAFAIIWATLFFMCGKGGADTRIFVAPWRIVLPALIFNFIFSIMTLYITYDAEKGYATFIKNLQEVFVQITGKSSNSMCSIVQDYVAGYNIHERNVCRYYVTLEILSWSVSWSWTIGLMILIFRILHVNDFRLLKVKVYEAPKYETDMLSSNEVQSDIGSFNEKQKEKQG